MSVSLVTPWTFIASSRLVASLVIWVGRGYSHVDFGVTHDTCASKGGFGLMVFEVSLRDVLTSDESTDSKKPIHITSKVYLTCSMAVCHCRRLILDTSTHPMF